MEHGHGLYSYLNLESTKTNVDKPKPLILLYSYLNLESTKTETTLSKGTYQLYSYLNLESTKTVLKEIEITE